MTPHRPFRPRCFPAQLISASFPFCKKHYPYLDHVPQMTPTLNGPRRQARVVTMWTTSDCVSGIDQTSWAAGIQKVLIIDPPLPLRVVTVHIPLCASLPSSLTSVLLGHTSGSRTVRRRYHRHTSCPIRLFRRQRRRWACCKARLMF